MKHRIIELDGLRGIAILMILIWHYFTNLSFSVPDYLTKFLTKLTMLTWSGVDLFFVLSGFLIVGILLDNKNSKNYFKVFYIRRICRIFPLYYAMCIIYIVLSQSGINISYWLFNPAIPSWSYLLFLQNIFMTIQNTYGGHWLAITWSLAVEEQFYLLIPLMIKFFPKNLLVKVFVILILSAPLFRITFNHFFSGLAAYILPNARADSLLIGGCLAIIFRSNLMPFIYLRFEQIKGIIVVFIVGYFIFTFFDYNVGTAFSHIWLATLSGLLLLLALTASNDCNSKVGAFFRQKWLLWLGTRSYAIYLLHQGVAGLIWVIFIGQQVPIITRRLDYGLVGLCLLITFIIAEISYRYFENKFIAYGYRYKY